mmetsp:Transcript_4572/g.10358  ORF Transcript_4572/g.10358 Transcript_4572/m.10358 type:complete len:234 (+) Transcript_4572:112-813(+)
MRGIAADTSARSLEHNTRSHKRIPAISRRGEGEKAAVAESEGEKEWVGEARGEGSAPRVRRVQEKSSHAAGCASCATLRTSCLRTSTTESHVSKGMPDENSRKRRSHECEWYTSDQKTSNFRKLENALIAAAASFAAAATCRSNCSRSPWHSAMTKKTMAALMTHMVSTETSETPTAPISCSTSFARFESTWDAKTPAETVAMTAFSSAGVHGLAPFMSAGSRPRSCSALLPR